MILFRNSARCALLLLSAGIATACAHAVPDPKQEFAAFAAEMAREHDFDAARVEDLLAHSERRQDIIDALNRPAESLPWYKYRPIFLQASRIADGVAFWNRHEALIEAVAEDYGVAPEIMVAVLGVETRYGTHTGRYRVIDALRTQAFDYPPRARFGRSELEAFLLLTREEGFDPLEPVGSYAGAMGMPQFISSSYRAYAVDYNGNGRRDLFVELPDVVGSIANYFARHGWEPGQPVAARASVSGNAWKALLDSDLKPGTTVGALRAAGVRIQADYPDARPARLLQLETESGPEYWVTLNNFYVITRYNHSPLYAMAVYQLGQAIAAEREAQQA
jgi:membrane-bound lytic murein transglycosylase B